MTVQPRALPRMERQRVRGFKSERFADLDRDLGLIRCTDRSEEF